MIFRLKNADVKKKFQINKLISNRCRKFRGVYIKYSKTLLSKLSITIISSERK